MSLIAVLIKTGLTPNTFGITNLWYSYTILTTSSIKSTNGNGEREGERERVRERDRERESEREREREEKRVIQ